MGGTGPVSAAVVVDHALCLTTLQGGIVEPDTDAKLLVVVTVYEVSR